MFRWSVSTSIKTGNPLLFQEMCQIRSELLQLMLYLAEVCLALLRVCLATLNGVAMVVLNIHSRSNDEYHPPLGV